MLEIEWKFSRCEIEFFLWSLPLYSHGLRHNHVLTVVLRANTFNFMSKCRSQPTHHLCFCQEHTGLVKWIHLIFCASRSRRRLSLVLSLMSGCGQSCGRYWVTDWGQGQRGRRGGCGSGRAPCRWKLETFYSFGYINECLLQSPDNSFISKY